MIKRIKHSLEHLIDKSSRNKTSIAEENLLNDFAFTQYQNSKWNEISMGNPDEVSRNIYEDIQLRIGKKKTFNPYLKYMAAASIIFLVGLGFFFKPSLSTEKQLSFKTSSIPKSIKLSDGSKIYLAANSSFQYPEKFEGDERKVSLLKGNAFFEIAKDKKHPFIIASGEIKTKVVGTSFHIQLSKEKCEVIVLTGKVNVTSKGQSVDLVPNEQALFQSQKLTKQLADKAFLVNWYATDITLNQTTLKQVITILQYKYGVSFEYDNEQVLAMPLTVFIKKDASLENVLEQINYITNLKFKVYGEIVKVN
ncbi:FecR family protein [Flavobacterium hibernum]|uniref:Iron dicitrate transport regulator FecR n=1 Tax=Flavobacterium hibernum TaxID=37752 RepID=A0A0D0EVF5_9FLAO|nr:FecR family protein [Flavobacterium hibernum]KIO50881.1 iron dicitrate transport regulator FecR [Flavobacterium hibernum]OXA85738.1 iron dicitrate transport regulator FecR [Flavobacterium hibernum]STO18557.1 fec operon regulator FecR [Flavobacterium hibernum]